MMILLGIIGLFVWTIYSSTGRVSKSAEVCCDAFFVKQDDAWKNDGIEYFFN